MSQSSTPSAAPGSTNTMMMLMPLMFGYITLITPAALTIYWVTSNILQIIQQGFSTGWSGLWPFPRPGAAPATATAGAKASKPATATTAAVSTSTAGGTGGTTPSAAGMEEGETAEVSAGRRRKMRKKKR
jgi:YidC/Oxa1 family membrane protein insertase